MRIAKVSKVICFLSLIYILSWFPATAQNSSNKIPKPLGKLVDIGGYHLHLSQTGKGKPTVVLISGAGDFSFDWNLIQTQVSKFSQVVSYDRAGSAWSDLGPTPRTMKQEAFELHLLLQKAKIKAPYILVGHSVGGLIARVFAAEYLSEVAGIVLVDSTTEDTTLNYQGKIVRVRDGAKNKTIPSVQTLKSSPPKPPTKEDLKQAEFNKQFFGAPKIQSPFDKLPKEIQTLRLWALNNPKLSAATDDFWAEELQALADARVRNPLQLGDIPLFVLIGGKNEGTPPGVTDEEWKKLSAEKRKQKMELAQLSRKSKIIIAEQSGHHIQLDEPQLIVDSIREILRLMRQQ